MVVCSSKLIRAPTTCSSRPVKEESSIKIWVHSHWTTTWARYQPTSYRIWAASAGREWATAVGLWSSRVRVPEDHPWARMAPVKWTAIVRAFSRVSPSNRCRCWSRRIIKRSNPCSQRRWTIFLTTRSRAVSIRSKEPAAVRWALTMWTKKSTVRISDVRTVQTQIKYQTEKWWIIFRR